MGTIFTCGYVVFGNYADWEKMSCKKIDHQVGNGSIPGEGGFAKALHSGMIQVRDE